MATYPPKMNDPYAGMDPQEVQWAKGQAAMAAKQKAAQKPAPAIGQPAPRTNPTMTVNPGMNSPRPPQWTSDPTAGITTGQDDVRRAMQQRAGQNRIVQGKSGATLTPATQQAAQRQPSRQNFNYGGQRTQGIQGMQAQPPYNPWAQSGNGSMAGNMDNPNYGANPYPPGSPRNPITGYGTGYGNQDVNQWYGQQRPQQNTYAPGGFQSGYQQAPYPQQNAPWMQQVQRPQWGGYTNQYAAMGANPWGSMPSIQQLGGGMTGWMQQPQSPNNAYQTFMGNWQSPFAGRPQPDYRPMPTLPNVPTAPQMPNYYGAPNPWYSQG